MIENFYDIITKIENFVDGLMIVDEKCIIKYNKQFSKRGVSFSEKDSIGKTPMEVWPNLNPEDSTCYRAVAYGETTVNKIQKLRYMSGEEATVIDNTFPVIENGKIIGAVSTSKFLDDAFLKDFIDLSNMTSTHTKDLYDPSDIIGSSQEINLLKYKIHKVSTTNSSILIYGETGTGKELVAQSIHSTSPRKGACFISQNCAAIPHTLLESIFFGTTKGSYTGAENKPGIFETANGGTIFLDEINSMDLSMQAKLLKAIEEKKITRIGGAESKKMDVRIIAAINEPPDQCIREGKMRADLFYRLSGIQIKVPSLQERRSDIPELTQHFIQLFNREMNASITGVSAEVVKVFTAYEWPGNIREFKNVLECAFNFASGNIIGIEDLPDAFQSHVASPINLPVYESDSLNEAVDHFEREFIRSRAKQARSLTELADQLKISKQTLNYKIKKHGLTLITD